MAIDYRKEVDSGFDRKRLVEANVVALLNKGVPLDIIENSPAFNFKHLEMIRNLSSGYGSKEAQLLEIYGGYSKETTEQIVPDRYSGVSHPVGGELYPMEVSEEKEKFKERDDCVREIERLRKIAVEPIEEEKKKIVYLIEEFKTKFPIFSKIIAALKELNALTKQKGNITQEEENDIIIKNGLDPKEKAKYNDIYNEYRKLIERLRTINIEYEAALKGEHSEEILDLIDKKNLIETEIVLRNTKLVNGFIRQKYRDLLVETDDLFQVCYLSLWEAVKSFDYRKGFKFSTLAYKYMDSEVKHSFKELTGYQWKAYWIRKKIATLIKTTSEFLGRKVSIRELIEYGLMDISEKSADGYLDMAKEYSFSDLYSDEELNDISETLLVEDEDDVYGEVYKNLLKEDIDDLLYHLTPRERKVIILRFGLNGEEPKGLAEIGKVFHVTSESIRRIEAKALRRLRYIMHAKKLEGYDGISEIRRY